MDRNEKAKRVIISLFVIAIVVCVVWFVWSTVWSWLTSLSLEGGGPRRLDVITAPPDSLIALDDEGQKIPPGDTLYVSGQDTIKIPSCGKRVEVWPDRKKPERIKMEEEFAFSDRGGLVYVTAEREENGLWIVHDQLESYRQKKKQETETRKKEEARGSRLGSNWQEVSWDTLMIGKTFVSTGFSKPGTYRIRTKEKPDLQIRLGKEVKDVELAKTSAGFWSGRVTIEYNDNQILEIASKDKPIRIIMRRL